MAKALTAPGRFGAHEYAQNVRLPRQQWYITTYGLRHRTGALTGRFTHESPHLQGKIMKKISLFGLTLVAGLFASAAVYAQAPAAAPAGTTAQCKDGSYFSGAKKQGACRGHKGIQTWYGAPAAAPTPAARTAAPAPTPAAPTETPAHRPARVNPATRTAAPGGGAGQVWVNASTKVYHCQGDRWYGKTKSGSYMSESEAKAQGFHPDHGKACQ